MKRKPRIRRDEIEIREIPQRSKLYHKNTINITQNKKCIYNIKPEVEKEIKFVNFKTQTFIYTFKFKEKIYDSTYNSIREKKTVTEIQSEVDYSLTITKNYFKYFFIFFSTIGDKLENNSFKGDFFMEKNNKKDNEIEFERKNFACDTRLPAIKYRGLRYELLAPSVGIFASLGLNFYTMFFFAINEYPKIHLKYDEPELKNYLKDKKELFSKFKDAEAIIDKILKS